MHASVCSLCLNLNLEHTMLNGYSMELTIYSKYTDTVQQPRPKAPPFCLLTCKIPQ